MSKNSEPCKELERRGREIQARLKSKGLYQRWLRDELERRGVHVCDESFLSKILRGMRDTDLGRAAICEAERILGIRRG